MVAMRDRAGEKVEVCGVTRLVWVIGEVVVAEVGTIWKLCM